MTTEDDFHRALDAHPGDWQTRLVFADFLDERGDARAEGYRAIAARQRLPLWIRRPNGDACWWHCESVESDRASNTVPRDWFVLLPTGPGSNLFWPRLTETSGVKSRRECENALALAFSQLPPDRRAALLEPPTRAE